MPEAKKQPKTATKLVDLDRLTQADVARLIGKPTSYLRNNEYWFDRDADGRYSGRQVVLALLKHAIETLPEVLEDADKHLLNLSLGSWIPDVPYGDAVLRMIDRLVEEHGPRAALEVGQYFHEKLRAEVESRVPFERTPPTDRAALEAEAAKWVAEKLAAVAEYPLRREGRIIFQCPHCRAWEWVGEWGRGELPRGYAIDRDTCPSCEAEGLRN